jgi:hypothetical protein
MSEWTKDRPDGPSVLRYVMFGNVRGVAYVMSRGAVSGAMTEDGMSRHLAEVTLWGPPVEFPEAPA